MKGRTVAESAWRPRRDTQDDGAWSKPSPSAAGAADGWLMPDADEEYELGGHNNNVDAFEVMRQQARAEWAQSHGVKVRQSELSVIPCDRSKLSRWRCLSMRCPGWFCPLVVHRDVVSYRDAWSGNCHPVCK